MKQEVTFKKDMSLEWVNGYSEGGRIEIRGGCDFGFLVKCVRPTQVFFFSLWSIFFQKSLLGVPWLGFNREASSTQAKGTFTFSGPHLEGPWQAQG